jgi:hypothetical protein
MKPEHIQRIVSMYPEVKDGLKGYAAWVANVAVKEGEAPDDDLRRKDERVFQRHMEAFLSEQMQRILQSAEEMRDA